MRVWGTGGWGVSVKVSGSGFKTAFGFRVSGLDLRVQGLGPRGDRQDLVHKRLS
jgi:hypothetical protein